MRYLKKEAIEVGREVGQAVPVIGHISGSLYHAFRRDIEPNMSDNIPNLMTTSTGTALPVPVTHGILVQHFLGLTSGQEIKAFEEMAYRRKFCQGRERLHRHTGEKVP
jgi:hypothetical protein